MGHTCMFIPSGDGENAKIVCSYDNNLMCTSCACVSHLVPARSGHIIVAVGSNIYIHGGMAAEKYDNDMYF